VLLCDPWITNTKEKNVINENIDVYLQPLLEELGNIMGWGNDS
jgi:hypothetical protein